MSDHRRDYGPAGCLDGCAESGGCGCLLLAISLIFAGLLTWRRHRKP